jgi:multicomponent Na+:H+ antiporter subunit D
VILLFQICAVVLLPDIFWQAQSDPLAALFKLDLGVDALSRVALFCIGIVVLVALFIAGETIEKGEQMFNFVNLLLIALIGMNCLVMLRDIFSLYVFLEIVSITSFILIAFRRVGDAFEGAFKYIVLSSLATVCMLSSIALLLVIGTGTSFASLKAGLAGAGHSRMAMLALALFLGGLFIKSGLVPFHGWLPDAYTAAAAPVSVLLAGIVTKVVGVYALMRVVISVFGFSGALSSVLLLIGALSVVVGALAAFAQNDFKRMLAYSSISQVGYIILGLGCGTPLGIAAAAFHFFNHAVFKSLLFVNSASLEQRLGGTDMNRMTGLAENMRVTGVSCLLASLSAAGLPPLAGFWSKVLIIIALWTCGFYAYAVIAALAGVLTLGYMLMLQRKVFFGQAVEASAGIREAGIGLALPSVILSIIIVVVGAGFPLMLNKFILFFNLTR